MLSNKAGGGRYEERVSEKDLKGDTGVGGRGRCQESAGGSRGQASQKELYFSFLWFDSSRRYPLDTWLGKDSSSSQNIEHIM